MPVLSSSFLSLMICYLLSFFLFTTGHRLLLYSDYEYYYSLSEIINFTGFFNTFFLFFLFKKQRNTMFIR